MTLQSTLTIYAIVVSPIAALAAYFTWCKIKQRGGKMKQIDRLMGFNANKSPNMSGWGDGHKAALIMPEGPERGIVALFKGWLLYADRHKTRFESGIGDDYFLGPEWVKIGLAIRVLLNGELGRLDGGTLDSVILDTLNAEGFDENGERP